MHLLEFDDGVLYKVFKFCAKESVYPIVFTCKRFYGIVLYFIKLFNVYQMYASDPFSYCDLLVKKDQWNVLLWYFQQVKSNILYELIYEQDLFKFKKMKSIPIEFIQALEKLMLLSTTDVSTFGFYEAAIETNNLDVFLHCCSKLPRSVKYPVEHYFSAFERRHLDGDDQVSNPDEINNLIVCCITHAKFDWIENQFGKSVYDFIPPNTWRMCVSDLLNYDEVNWRPKFDEILQKYFQLYNQRLTIHNVYPIVKRNDKEFFEWAMVNLYEECVGNYENVVEGILRAGSDKLYELIFIKLYPTCKPNSRCWECSAVYQHLWLFELFLKHRDKSVASDEFVWNNLLRFNPSDEFINIANNYLTQPLQSYVHRIDSIKCAETLTKMNVQEKLKVTDGNVMIWLIEHGVKRYDQFKKPDLFWASFVDHNIKLLQIIKQHGDLEEALWYPITGTVENYCKDIGYPKFFVRVVELLGYLPTLTNENIENIVYFAYDSNDILLFDILQKFGVDLSTNQVFLDSLDYYDDVGLKLWKKLKLISDLQ